MWQYSTMCVLSNIKFIDFYVLTLIQPGLNMNYRSKETKIMIEITMEESKCVQKLPFCLKIEVNMCSRTHVWSNISLIWLARIWNHWEEYWFSGRHLILPFLPWHNSQPPSFPCRYNLATCQIFPADSYLLTASLLQPVSHQQTSPSGNIYISQYFQPASASCFLDKDCISFYISPSSWDKSYQENECSADIVTCIIIFTRKIAALTAFF